MRSVCYVLFLIIIGCANRVQHNNTVTVPPDTFNTTPDTIIVKKDTSCFETANNMDTIIPVSYFAKFSGNPYGLDLVQEEELDVNVKEEHVDSITKYLIHLKDIDINYTYNFSDTVHYKDVATIELNGRKGTFVDENGQETLNVENIQVIGLTYYTLADKKYLYVSYDPISIECGYDTNSEYGMLIKVSPSSNHNVMLLKSYNCPQEPYTRGKMYLRQCRSSGKLFFLLNEPASYDINNKADSVSIRMKELHL